MRGTKSSHRTNSCPEQGCAPAPDADFNDYIALICIVLLVVDHIVELGGCPLGA